MDGDLETDWTDDVERLLFDGESVEYRLERDEGRVVVTSHRVLAFTPDATGENYRAVDRPNVEGVSLHAGGNRGFLRRALTPGIAGIGLLAAAALVDVESYAPTAEDAGLESGARGAGSIRGTLESVRSLFAMLDALILACGLIATLLALAFLGLYVRSRERTLLIAVAGEENIEVPLESDADPAVDALTRAIRPEPATANEVGSGPGPASDRSDRAGTDPDDTPDLESGTDAGGTPDTGLEALEGAEEFGGSEEREEVGELERIDGLGGSEELVGAAEPEEIDGRDERPDGPADR